MLILRVVCTKILLTILFVMAKSCNQLNHPSIGGWIYKYAVAIPKQIRVLYAENNKSNS